MYLYSFTSVPVNAQMCVNKKTGPTQINIAAKETPHTLKDFSFAFTENYKDI